MGRLYGPVQVACYKGIDGRVLQPVAQGPGLSHSLLVKFALCLSLHNLPGVVNRLSVSY